MPAPDTSILLTTGAGLSGIGSAGSPLVIDASGVTPGSYTNVDLTVGSDGRITAAANGSAGGASGRTYQTLTSGSLSITIGFLGAGVIPAITVNATGDYSIVLPAGVDVVDIDIFGNNSVITGGGDFTIRVDNSANSKDLKFISQIHNPSNGALVDVFTQSNNHTRTFAGNVTSYVYPGMTPYGVTGFDIQLSR